MTGLPQMSDREYGEPPKKRPIMNLKDCRVCGATLQDDDELCPECDNIQNVRR